LTFINTPVNTSVSSIVLTFEAKLTLTHRQVHSINKTLNI